MKIAIQAADLDDKRIDGTRVYILNLLKLFGRLGKTDQFLIYHRDAFNLELTPPDFQNYIIRQKPFPFIWSQIRFAFEIWKDKPEILWMPMQALPIFRRKKLRTAITIHDLAFKYFPDFFPRRDLWKLNFLTDYAIRNANKIIAVSESTREDILKFYPNINPEKIRVIHHGFDGELFSQKVSSEELENFLSTNYKLQTKNYLLYVGALQPRKNLGVLIEAFEKVKLNHPDLKLVLVGEKAWLWKDILEKIKKSPVRKDILLPGKLSFKEVCFFYQGASAFIFPSLYEGFGLPILEALAMEVPVISANNSSLPEVGGEAVLYFKNQKELVCQLENLLGNRNLREELRKKGYEQLKKFSWEKCAQETLDFIKN